MIRATGRHRHTVALAALVALVALAACGKDAIPSPRGLPTGTLVIETAGGEVQVGVEIAETVEDRTQGLRGRESLGEDLGMVFLHESPVPSAFTMADTLIPLSLAVWGTDEQILVVLDMEPCPEEPCPIYDPGVPFLGAVEVNQGFFAENEVSVGDRVRLDR